MELKGIIMISTYAKLDRDREKVNTNFFCNGLTTWDAWEVDESGLNDPLLSFCGFHKLFGEAFPIKSAQCRVSGHSPGSNSPKSSVRHRQSCRASSSLRLNDLITAELHA